MEDQFALVKSAELHRLNIVSETLQAQLLQLFFISSKRELQRRGMQTECGGNSGEKREISENAGRLDGRPQAAPPIIPLHFR